MCNLAMQDCSILSFFAFFSLPLVLEVEAVLNHTYKKLAERSKTQTCLLAQRNHQNHLFICLYAQQQFELVKGNGRPSWARRKRLENQEKQVLEAILDGRSIKCNNYASEKTPISTVQLNSWIGSEWNLSDSPRSICRMTQRWLRNVTYVALSSLTVPRPHSCNPAKDQGPGRTGPWVVDTLFKQGLDSTGGSILYQNVSI